MAQQDIKTDQGFVKMGMDKDSHPSQLKETQYTHALNANTENESGNSLNLTNEKSNILASRFKDGFRVIGFENDIDTNSTYFFLVNTTTGVGEFGVIENNQDTNDLPDTLVNCTDCDTILKLSEPLENQIQPELQTYTTLLSDFSALYLDRSTGTYTCYDRLDPEYAENNLGFNFNINYPIKSIVIKNEKCGKMLYFSDNYNPPRHINLSDLDGYFVQDVPCAADLNTLCMDFDELRIFKLFNFPQIEPVSIQLGGRLKMGVYQFLLAYCDPMGNEISPYYSITNPISIFDKNNRVLTQPDLANRTNLSIKLEVSGLDKKYSHYKVAVIQTADIEGAVRYFIEGVHTINDNSVIYGTEQDKVATSIDALLIDKIHVEQSEGLRASNSILFQYGITKKKEINLQPVVNLMGEFLQWQTHIAPENLYEDGALSSKYLGYNRDEVVPFSIRFLLDGGYETALFPLIARTPKKFEDVPFGDPYDMEELVNTSGPTPVAIAGPTATDVNSILKNLLDCNTTNRIYRWQYYNTAEEDPEGAPCPAAPNVQYIPVTEVITKTCTAEAIATVPEGILIVDTDDSEYTSFEEYITLYAPDCVFIDSFPTSSIPQILNETGWTHLNWTGSFATGWDHITGNLTPLVNTVPAIVGLSYQIGYTVTGVTAGSFTIAFGGFTTGALNATGTQSFTATTTSSFVVTPTSPFDGNIVFSINPVVPYSLCNYLNPTLYNTVPCDTNPFAGMSCPEPPLGVVEEIVVDNVNGLVEDYVEKIFPTQYSNMPPVSNCLMHETIVTGSNTSPTTEGKYDTTYPLGYDYLQFDTGTTAPTTFGTDTPIKVLIRNSSFVNENCIDALDIILKNDTTSNNTQGYFNNYKIDSDLTELIDTSKSGLAYWDTGTGLANYTQSFTFVDIDSVTPPAAGDTLDIIISSVPYTATFATTFLQTAINFEIAHGALIASTTGCAVTRVGATIIITNSISSEAYIEEAITGVGASFMMNLTASGYTQRMHKNALWFKGEVEDKKKWIIDLSKQKLETAIVNDTAVANPNNNYRVSLFKSCSSPTPYLSFIVNNADNGIMILMERVELTPGIYNYDLNVTLSDPTNISNSTVTILPSSPTYIAGAFSKKYYVVIDTIIESDLIDTDPDKNFIETPFIGSPTTYYKIAFENRFIVKPTKGCYTITKRDIEYSRIDVTWDSITLAKKFTYTKKCNFLQPIVQACRAIPFRKGNFAFWESEQTYADNDELFNSSTLKIASSQIPVAIQSKFEDVFTDGELDGYYTFKADFWNGGVKKVTDFTCRNIRHFRFPDNKVAPFMTDTKISPFGDSIIFPLGVTIDETVINSFLDIAVTNGLITKEDRNKITKYEIFRGDIELNRSIVASGLLYDMRKYIEKSKTIHYSNYPYNTYSEDALNLDSNTSPETIGTPTYPTSKWGETNRNYTFHSPETDYERPTLPSEMTVQGYVFGMSRGHFDEVKGHPKWTILSAKAKDTAGLLAGLEVALEVVLKTSEFLIQSSQNMFTGAWGGWVVGLNQNYVGSGISIGATILTGTLMTIEGLVFRYGQKRYEWLKIFRDFGATHNFAYYYFSDGNYNYLGDEQVIGNSLRGLNIAKYLKDGRYVLTNQITAEKITVNNLDREESVFLSFGNHNMSYPPTYRNYDKSSGDSSLTWATLAGVGDQSGRSSEVLKNIASPYVAIKNYLPSQYGTLNSIKWKTTSHIGNLLNPLQSCLPIFGGDTFISRHTLKRKMPMFLVTAMKQADLMPYNYYFYSNIGRNPKFYVSYEINPNFSSGSVLFPDIDYGLAFDGGTTHGGNYYEPPSKFYLYYYGVPSFLAETRINTNYRYAGKDPKESFFPLVGDLGEWTQEETVSIRDRNVFKYNSSYSVGGSLIRSRTLANDYSKSFYDCIQDMPNGIIASLPDSSENSLYDPWLIYRPLDSFDFPSNYGKLKDIVDAESQAILVRFENTSVLYNKVDSKVDDGGQVTAKFLGGNSFFQRRSTSFHNTKLGFGGTQNFAYVSNEYGHFYVDAKRGQVIQVPSGGEGMVDIAAITGDKPSGMRNWFKEHLPFKILRTVKNADIDNPYNGVGISMGWDSRYRRVFITKKDYIPVKDCIEFIEGEGYFYNVSVCENDPSCPEGYTYNTETELCEGFIQTEAECFDNLKIEKEADVEEQLAGGTVVFTITVTNEDLNDGINFDASAVVVQDNLPSGYNYVSATATVGTITNIPVGNIIWTIGTLAPEATATLTLTVTMNGEYEDDYVNIASVNSQYPDISPENNEVSFEVNLIPFIAVFRTTISNETITLPYLNAGGTYSGTIYWDYQVNTAITSENDITNITHMYPDAGDHEVRVYGRLEGWAFYNDVGPNSDGVDKTKIRTVKRWGPWKSKSEAAFWGCTSLTLNSTLLMPQNGPIDTPIQYSSYPQRFSYMFAGCTAITTINLINTWDVTGGTSFSAMFLNCSLFNDNLSSWNVTNSRDFRQMFQSCTVFNNGSGPGIAGSGLNNWVISTTSTPNISMFRMFNGCESFNQNVSSWNVSKVDNMALMFNRCFVFNQPLANWERTTPGNISTLSNVTTMLEMFLYCYVFNQPLNNWDTSSVTNMSGMFSDARLFNQPLNSWDTSLVTNMSGMFGGSGSLILTMVFDQNIGSWDTTNVTNMNAMFQNSDAFNNGSSSDINNWNTTNVEYMSDMFYKAYNFNQPIGNWKVGNVITMKSMFYGNPVFNQPLSNWERTTPDVSSLVNVTDMAAMFNGAIAFDQNIGNWAVSNVQFFDIFPTIPSGGFMYGKSPANFSSANLAAIYDGWSSLPSVQSGISIDFSNIDYDTIPGAAGRAILVGTYSWIINNGNPV